MGVCSYCKKNRREHEECFGWDEARSYCGVERGPKIEAQPLRAFTPANALPPIGTSFRIDHDGFEGVVIGYYTRLDGKRGVVGQQIGTNIVHVYGEKWLKP